MTEYYEAETDYAVPTGEFVAEWLEDNGMTRTELARRMGVSRKHLQMVVAGAPVTPDFAQKLALVTGVPTERWLRLEAAYQADKIRLATTDALSGHTDLLDAIGPLSSVLRREGIVRATRRKPGVLLMEILAFFGLASVEELRHTFHRPAAAFRQAPAFDASDASVAGWLRLGELAVEQQLDEVAVFNADRLRSVIPGLRALSRAAPEGMVPTAVEMLASVGVALVFVPEVAGCRSYGATRWFGETPVVQLSMRGKDDGNLWLTLFHEIGHILFHPRQEFIDGFAGAEEAEREADEFARNTLIPVEEAWRLDDCRSIADVEALAEELGVSAGVVVGRLHRDKKWPYEYGQRLFVRFEFAEAAR